MPHIGKGCEKQVLKGCSLSVHRLSGSLHEAGVPLKWSVIKDYISNTQMKERLSASSFLDFGILITSF